jgi:hypothetical protein
MFEDSGGLRRRSRATTHVPSAGAVAGQFAVRTALAGALRLAALGRRLHNEVFRDEAALPLIVVGTILRLIDPVRPGRG